MAGERNPLSGVGELLNEFYRAAGNIPNAPPEVATAERRSSRRWSRRAARPKLWMARKRRELAANRNG